MLTDILAIVDVDDEDGRFLKHARDFARFHGAYLSVAVLWAVKQIDHFFTVAPPYMPMIDVHEAGERKRQRLARWGEQDDLEISLLRDSTGCLADQAPILARYADLVLFGPTAAYGDPALRHRVLTQVVLSSGRPVLIWPDGREPDPVRRLALGWNGTREATRALCESLAFARPGASVDVVVVDATPQLKENGYPPGELIARHLSRHGFDASIHHVKSNGLHVSAALVDFAGNHRADMLAIGAAAHSRVREMLLGGVTHDLLGGADPPASHLLRAAAVPILFGH
ncbi:universal stress protein [Novosphingobium sp. BL-52-GroH]|uniref:universal stress protein n=1 Tax=Novosphingobium sp. BL-52-GroH TaxID=3349877 RepID=UPI00384ABC43